MKDLLQSKCQQRKNKKPARQKVKEDRFDPKVSTSFFLPSFNYYCSIAEFVIETKTSEGDGSKVRELTDAGKTLYINICSSELIEVPKDKFGASLDDSRSVADGLEVPLLIGPVRPLGEEANAIDVIFNPIVPKICKAERYFRGQILELAQQWILEETPLRFKKNQYEDISDVEYKGGLGDKKDIPVLFNVDESLEKVDPPENPSASKSSSKDKNKSATLDEAIQNSHQKNDKKTISKDDSKNILSNPSSLLKELQKDQNTSTIGELKTLSTTKKGSIPSSKDKKDDKSDSPIKKAPAIVELDKDKNPIITSVEPPKEEKKKQSVSFAPASASAAANFDIQERPKNVPSKIEQKAIADLLDQFENPDAITLPDHESEDLSASIINELSKMLVGGSNPSLPVPAPPAPAPATAPPTKPAQVAPPAPKPAPAQQSVPAQPSIPQSVAISSSKSSSVSVPPPSQLLVVYFNNNSPEIAPVAYKNDEENAVLTVEISGMKSTATLESLVMEV